MTYLEQIKQEIKEATNTCTHSNEKAEWFTRVDAQGMAIYQFNKDGDLSCKFYKSINTFAKAIGNKLNK